MFSLHKVKAHKLRVLANVSAKSGTPRFRLPCVTEVNSDVMFAPRLLSGFSEFEVAKFKKLIPASRDKRAHCAQNWSLIGLPESSSAPQLGKIRIRMTHPTSNHLMNEHAFFEYRVLLTSTPHAEEKGERLHCLIKMEIADHSGRLRRSVELEQEVGDLILFLINPGPHRRICHSSICKADESRLHELGPATDFHRVGNSEVYVYAT
jgi:hypothetical protein